MDVDFNNHYYGSIEIFGFDFWITSTQISTMIIFAILLAFTIYVNISMKKYQKIPKGLQNVVEFAVESMDKFVRETMGDKYYYFAYWFFGVIVFIFCSNISGLFGMRPPTADLATTLSLGLTTFFLIHIFGIWKNRKEYFKGYTEPFIIFLPMNIISELALPVSLSFRLFGNILAGLIILGLLYAALPIILQFIVPEFFHAYFDLFSGTLQSYIFVILSLTFIAQKLPETE